MKHFDIKIIVVPTDFSDTAEAAIKHASNIAKAFNSEIHLVHVLEAYTANVNIPEFREVDAVIVNLFEKVEQKLQAYGDRLSKETGIKIATHAATGGIKAKVVSYAKRVNADLIVTGTHGASGFREFFMGSNSYRIVSEASCPVLSVNGKETDLNYSNIVLPIDSSPTSRQKVVQAVDIAKRFGSTVHIAELCSNDEPEHKAHLNQMVKQVQEYLDKHGIKHITRELFGSNLASLTINFANTIDADLIIMMTEQEPRITGFFLGQYAQQVVNHSHIPVMSIHPDQHNTAVEIEGFGI